MCVPCFLVSVSTLKHAASTSHRLLQTTVMLAIGDALAVALQQKRGFTYKEYALEHLADALGRRLKPVRVCMRIGERMAVNAPDTSIAEAMI